MPQTPLDLNLVRAFVAIYEAKSVTLAAERLELAQPTLSHALSRLRTAYGDRLFERGTNGLRPTKVADQLFEVFTPALASIDVTLQHRQAFNPAESTRRFRIAMSDIGVLYFAPLLFRRFQERAPHVELDVVELEDSVHEQLALGHLDLAIGNLAGLPATTHREVLFHEHYVCLMAKDHPHIGSRLSVQSFMASRHLMVSSKSLGHRLIDQVLAQRGLHRTIAARVPQFTVVPPLISQSDLLVILPSRVAELYAAQGPLKALDVPVAIPGFDVCLYWHARHAADPAHDWLKAEIVETLGRL